MPKKSKPTSDQITSDAEMTAATASKKNGSSPRRRTTTAAKKTKEPGKKKGATREPKPAPRTHKAPEPTDEEIRIRAYFVSERRHRLNLAGDASSDWLEARRQLVSEAANK